MGIDRIVQRSMGILAGIVYDSIAAAKAKGLGVEAVERWLAIELEDRNVTPVWRKSSSSDTKMSPEPLPGGMEELPPAVPAPDGPGALPPGAQARRPWVTYQEVVAAFHGVGAVGPWVQLGEALDRRGTYRFVISEDGAGTLAWRLNRHGRLWLSVQTSPAGPIFEVWRQRSSDVDDVVMFEYSDLDRLLCDLVEIERRRNPRPLYADRVLDLTRPVCEVRALTP